MKRKTLKELNLIDDFLMNCIAVDPEVAEPCFKRILSVLLQRDIGSVHVVAQAIKNMLNYIQKSVEENVADEATGEIDRYVKHVKSKPELEEGVMTLGDYFDQERLDAKIEDILELLEETGPVPEHISNRLRDINDPEELSRLHKISAHVESIADFEAAMNKQVVSV